MTINFWKMSGAGNDFVLISGLFFLIPALKKLAKILCERKLSVGADGLLWVKKSASNSVTVKYFNSDGSEAFCGNGSRCAAWWAYSSGLMKSKEFFLETAGGSLLVKIAGFEKVRMKMPDIGKIFINCRKQWFKNVKKLHFLKVGVPHAVVPVDDVDSIDVETLGKYLRHHEFFGKPGSNVNFVEIKGGKFRIRTYERGVEAETFACGSGITASAIACGIAGDIKSPISCVSKSGEIFKVWFKKLNDGKIKDVYVQGPAKMVFEGKINLK